MFEFEKIEKGLAVSIFDLSGNDIEISEFINDFDVMLLCIES